MIAIAGVVMGTIGAEPKRTFSTIAGDF